jgi:hypothetical protein
MLRGGDRLAGQDAEQADEQPVLVAGGARKDRDPLEAAGPQSPGRDLGQDAVAESIRLVLRVADWLRAPCEEIPPAPSPLGCAIPPVTVE